ncbi:cell wall hydrolase [Gallintestinimicrobium propionicum]|uniref:cell wall hydrolase n=1 Tax=Gallintestinimicrobium propionicum TaxID=2981770 RepID=UPI0021D3DF5C|nr:cell wall hydrolase [Gallintestinimicrobium propionicum]MCU6689013.1 cell wall hydrolase [Gallintestinimicrobium propionicum]
MEVRMNGKGRKLFRSAVGILTSVMMMGAYTTTAMASGIGVIDAKDMLDIHAEANTASAVVGQVMEDGHVAILAKYNDWVQIQAGEIAGWVPAENLVETEISNEEAVAANEQVIAERTGATASEDEFFAEEEVQQDETAALQAEASEAAQNEIEEVQAAEEAARLEAEVQAKAAAEEAARLEAEAQAKAAAEEAAQLEAEAQAKAAEEAARLEAEAQAKAAEEAARLEAEAQAKAAAEEAAQLEAEAQQAALAAQAAQTAAISAEELKLLANIIYCEAGSESYVGKVAVGNVIMNRVKSASQPNTITEVVYAKGQFSPVRNGSLQRALSSDKADAACYQAAIEALAGAQPVGGKLFFRRNNGRSGQVIGHHVFY